MGAPRPPQEMAIVAVAEVVAMAQSALQSGRIQQRGGSHDAQRTSRLMWRETEPAQSAGAERTVAASCLRASGPVAIHPYRADLEMSPRIGHVSRKYFQT